MNKKTIVSISIIIIIILVVIIYERINKKDDDYIVNGEQFKDFSWEKKYGNYYNKQTYKNYIVTPPYGINWSRQI